MPRRTLPIVITLLVVGLVSAAGYLQWSRHQPVERGARFVISPGQGASAVARSLVDAGVLAEPYSFTLWSHLRGQTGSIKAGEYRIEEGTTLLGLLDRFVAGDVVTYSVTLIEGWTFDQFLAALTSHQTLGQDLADRSAADIMASLGQPGLHPEGRFFPDTYVFDSGATVSDVLRLAFDRMGEVLDREWAARGPETRLNDREEALVLASIIEKETGDPGERAVISAVFNNRLRIGMKLQTDPTVIYGLGEEFDGNLTRAHLRQDTPYNTYTRRGLPPTPIANPGADSIRAAVNPAESRALYFVSRGDGSHHFSETLDEHNRAVARYQLGGGGKNAAAEGG